MNETGRVPVLRSNLRPLMFQCALGAAPPCAATIGDRPRQRCSGCCRREDDDPSRAVPGP